MDIPAEEIAAAPSRSVAEEVRLRGLALRVAQLGWVVIATLTVGLDLLSIPTAFTLWQTVCSGPGCSPWQPTPEMAHSLLLAGISPLFWASYYVAVSTIYMLVHAAVALVIFRRRPDNSMALFTALMLVTLGGATSAGTMLALPYVDATWRLLTEALGAVGTVGFFVFFCIFPDGRFVPRWALWASLLWAALSLLRLLPPLHSALQPYYSVAFWPFVLSVVVAQIYRYRRVSPPIQRQQTKWVVFGLSVAIAGFMATAAMAGILVGNLNYGKSDPVVRLAADAVIYLFLLMIPVSIGLAILRSRLYEIDVVINRTLVYGVLTSCVVGIYVLVIVGLGSLVQTQGNIMLSLLATGLIAVLFQPLRDRLQRGVNRLMYGERNDPYAAISLLGQRLESTLAPDAVLPAVVQTVALALKLPYAAVELQTPDGPELTAEYATNSLHPGAGGDHPAMRRRNSLDLLNLPLTYQGERVGSLLLAPRAPGEAFTRSDLRLLEGLARHAGVAAHAVRLTTDLQRSREHLVTAREEERRRLRGDLHDGLGPMLASITLKLDAARNLMTSDPNAADRLLAEVKAQSQAAVVDIRRLVYGLRPPALDDLGLVQSLREYAHGLNTTADLSISIDTPSPLPPLPAAVEVAVYRIVQEALTNVVRHSGAYHCSVQLSILPARTTVSSGILVVDISDDGVGLSPGHRPGVGLVSMKERAAELGGRCHLEVRPGGGTRVVAELVLSEQNGSLPRREGSGEEGEWGANGD